MPSRERGRCPHRGTGALGASAVLALLVVGALWPAGVPAPLGPGRADAAAATRVRVRAAFGRLPLSFEPNAGQSEAAVQFLARGPGYTLYLTGPEAVLVLRDPGAAPDPAALGAAATPNDPLGSAPEAVVVRLGLVDANPAVVGEGEEQQPGHVSYFLGNDPSRWRAGLPTYGRVRYQAVYPGVDLIWHGGAGALEYDFEVAPGADPGAIRLRLEGSAGVALGSDGALVVPVHG